MSGALPVLLMALAGLLFGGAWSLRRQAAPAFSVVLVAGLGVLAFAGGVLWLIPR